MALLSEDEKKELLNIKGLVRMEEGEEKRNYIKMEDEEIKEEQAQPLVSEENIKGFWGDMLSSFGKMGESTWNSLVYATNDVLDHLIGFTSYAKIYGGQTIPMVQLLDDRILEASRQLLETTKKEEEAKIIKMKEEASKEGKMGERVAIATGEILGGLPTGIAEFMANIPWAMARQMVEELDKGNKDGINIVSKMITAGAKRHVVGKVFHAINKMKPVKALLSTGLLGFGDYSTEVAINADWNENFLQSYLQSYNPIEAVKTASVLTFLQAFGINKKMKMEKLIKEEAIPKMQKEVEEKAKMEKEKETLVKKEYSDAKIDNKPIEEFVKEKIEEIEKLAQNPETKEQAIEMIKETAEALKKVKEGEKEVITESVDLQDRINMKLQEFESQLKKITEKRKEERMAEKEKEETTRYEIKNKLFRNTIKAQENYKDNELWAKHLEYAMPKEKFEAKIKDIIEDVKAELEVAEEQYKPILNNKLKALNKLLENSEEISKLTTEVDYAKLREYFKEIGDIIKGKRILEEEDLKEPEIIPEVKKPEAIAEEPKKAIEVIEPKKEKYEEVIQEEQKVITPAGKEYKVKYALVDIDKLNTSHKVDMSINEKYPQEYQPRERQKLLSQIQIGKIEENLKPELLMGNINAAEGSPIIDVSGNVLSGNARTIALKRLYKKGKLKDYTEYLRNNARKYGFNPEDIKEGIILVRIKEGNKEENINFTREANESSVAAYSITEKINNIAKKIDLEDLENISNLENISSGANSSFHRIVAKLIPDTEKPLYFIDKTPNKQFYDLCQAVIFQKAYNNPKLLSLIAEEPDIEIKNIVEALKRNSAIFAKVQEANKTAKSNAVDLIDDLVEGIELIRKAKKQGIKVEELINQGLLFKTINDRANKIALFLNSNIRNIKSMSDFMRDLANAILGNVEGKMQKGLFEEKIKSNDEILNKIIQNREIKSEEQVDLLEELKRLGSKKEETIPEKTKEIKPEEPKIEKPVEEPKVVEKPEIEEELKVEEEPKRKIKKISEMTPEESKKAEENIKKIEDEMAKKGDIGSIAIGKTTLKGAINWAIANVFKDYPRHVVEANRKQIVSDIELKMYEYIKTYGLKPSGKIIQNAVKNYAEKLTAKKRTGVEEYGGKRGFKKQVGFEEVKDIIKEKEITTEGQDILMLIEKIKDKIADQVDEKLSKTPELTEKFIKENRDDILEMVAKDGYLVYMKKKKGKVPTESLVRKWIQKAITQYQENEKRQIPVAKGTAGELLKSETETAEEKIEIDEIIKKDDKIKNKGYITDFGLGDALKKLNEKVSEKIRDKKILNEWKKKAMADLILMEEMASKINKSQLKEDKEAYKRMEQDFFDKYGITADNYKKHFSPLVKDIKEFQRYISFPETLAKKNINFKRLFENCLNVLDVRVKLIWELRDNYELSSILKQLKSNERVKKYLMDLNWKIFVNKLKDADYMKKEGFKDEEIMQIKSWIENNNEPRKKIYSLLNSKENWLKQRNLTEVVNKLRVLREKWSTELIDTKRAVKDINTMREYGGLNDEDIALLKKYKALNDKMYEETLNSLLQAVEEKYADNPEKMIAEKIYVLKYISKHYDPYYFNKSHPRAKYVVSVKGEGGRPIAYFFENISKATAEMKQLRQMGYEDVNLTPLKDLARLDYVLPIDKLSEFNAYDPLLVKSLFKGDEKGLFANGEIKGYWGRLLQAVFLPSENIDLQKNTASYVMQWANFIAKRRYKGEMVRALNDLQNQLPNSNMLMAATKLYNDFMFPKTNWMARLTGYIGAYYLWGNIKSAMIQFTQPFLITYPYLVGMTNSPIKSIDLLKKGYTDTFAFFMKPEKLDKIKYENAKNFWERELEMGTREVDIIREYARSGKWLDKVIDFGMFPFQYSDKIQRLIAFFAGYNNNKNYKEGVEVSRETNFNYSRANRPELARGLLSPLFALRMFEGHYFRLMKEYIQNKQWEALLAQTLTTGVIGGLVGQPFASTLINGLQWAGVNIDYELRKLLKNHTITDLFLYGIPTFAGANIAYSVSIGRYLPTLDNRFGYNFLKSVLGPLGDVYDRTSRAINYSLLQKRWGKAFMTTLPLTVYNLMRAREIYEEGIGEKGKKKMITPEEFYLQYLVILRGIGIQNLEQSLYYSYEAMKRDKRYSQAEKAEYYRYLLSHKSPLRKIIEKYQKEGRNK